MRSNDDGIRCFRRGPLGYAWVVIALVLSVSVADPGPAKASGQAQSSDPAAIIKHTTERLYRALERGDLENAEDSARARRLVAKIVMPQIDFDLVARWTLGRHWRRATSEQKQRFKKEFRALLVRTYTAGIVKGSDASIDYLPPKVNAEGTQAMVRTRVSVSEGPPMDIQYRLRRVEDSWKVFDISVEGSSLVSTYRTSFAREAAQAGMDGLIRKLAARNEEAGGDEFDSGT